MEVENQEMCAWEGERYFITHQSRDQFFVSPHLLCLILALLIPQIRVPLSAQAMHKSRNDPRNHECDTYECMLIEDEIFTHCTFEPEHIAFGQRSHQLFIKMINADMSLTRGEVKVGEE
jgi:hypothetical protein